MVQLLWKTVWCFPTKLNVHLSWDSKLSRQSAYLKEVKAETQTDFCPPIFIAAYSQSSKGRGKQGFHQQMNG